MYCRPTSLTSWAAMTDELGNVPPSHDTAEGRQGPSVLAAGPVRPRRPQDRPANRRAPRRTQCGRARAGAGAGSRDHRGAGAARPLPVDDVDAIPVQLKRMRLERGRTLGDVWLGWTLWRAPRLDELLARLLPEGREAVPWHTMAVVLVLARLSEPSSELHIAETWYRDTALVRGRGEGAPEGRQGQAGVGCRQAEGGRQVQGTG